MKKNINLGWNNHGIVKSVVKKDPPFVDRCHMSIFRSFNSNEYKLKKNISKLLFFCEFHILSRYDNDKYRFK